MAKLTRDVTSATVPGRKIVSLICSQQQKKEKQNTAKTLSGLVGFARQ